jgi:acetyl esterase
MLQAAGVETECHEYPNALHGFTYKKSADAIDAWGKMATFLEKHLNQNKASTL